MVGSYDVDRKGAALTSDCEVWGGLGSLESKLGGGSNGRRARGGRGGGGEVWGWRVGMGARRARL